MVVQLNRCVARHRRDHNAVKTFAAVEVEHTAGTELHRVVALAAVDRIGTRRDDDGVVAAVAPDAVDASAHVDDFATRAADEFVVALAAEEAHAAAAAADKFVLANTPADDAGGSTPGDHETVVADAAVEVELGRDIRADIDRVVALAAKTDDAAHAARGVRLGLAERLHADRAAVLVDIESFVDGVVVEIAAAVAPCGVAHVQEERAVGCEMADIGRVAEAPQITAGHRDAHDRDLRREVGAGRRDIDLATETGDREVDLEEAEVDLEIERSVGRCGEARPA